MNWFSQSLCLITSLQSSWDQHGAHLGPVGPRWAPCWPHEPCYQGTSIKQVVFHLAILLHTSQYLFIYAKHVFKVALDHVINRDSQISDRWKRLFIQLPNGIHRMSIFGHRDNDTSSTGGVLIDDVSIQSCSSYCEYDRSSTFGGVLT